MAQILTGLDVGTATIRAVVIELQRRKPTLRKIIREPSQGLKRGAIVDMAETTQSLSRVLAQLRDVSRYAPKNIYANFATAQSRVQHSKGIVAVSRADSEIYADDVDRVLRASQAIALGSNRMVMDTITKEFIVDGVGDITDPIGLSGSRLEVNTLVVEAYEPHVRDFMKTVNLSGGSIKKMIFCPLATARAALSKVQKDLGTVVIDLGFGITTMSVYEENRLLGAAIFPVGAGNITKDIAIGLRIPFPIAESLKLEYGYALAKDVGTKESIDLAKFSSETKGVISRRLLAEIIEARLIEIFEFVQGELKLLGKATQLAGGAVLTGGGAKMPGVVDLSYRELRLTSQIGLVADRQYIGDDSQKYSMMLDDPEFVNVFGLVLRGIKEEKWISAGFSVSDLKSIWRHFLP